MEFYLSMAWKVTFFVIFLCALKPGICQITLFATIHEAPYIYRNFCFCVGLGNHQNSSFAMSSSSIRVNTLNRLYPVISLTSGVYVTTVLDNLRTFVLDGGESSDVTSAVSITSDIISLSLKSTVTIEASVPGAVHTCLSKNLFSSSEIVLTPSATPRRTPNRRNTITVDYKLILCVIVPLFSILAFVIVLTVLLCIRRYRK